MPVQRRAALAVRYPPAEADITKMVDTETVVLSVSTHLRVIFLQGSSHEALPPIEPTRSLVGVPLAVAWPDTELVQAARQISKLRRLAVLTAAVVGKRRNWYRYRIQPMFGIADGDKHENFPAVTGLSVVGTKITDTVEAEDGHRPGTKERKTLRANETAAHEASRLKTDNFTHISYQTRTPLDAVPPVPLFCFHIDASVQHSSMKADPFFMSDQGRYAKRERYEEYVWVGGECGIRASIWDRLPRRYP
jgi:hypothetical protein